MSWLIVKFRSFFHLGLTTPIERHNMLAATVEGCLVVAGLQIIVTFVSVYLLTLGGSAFQVGLVTSLPFLFNAMAVAWAGQIRGSPMSMLRHALSTGIMHRFLIAALPLAPLFHRWAPWWIIALYSLASAAMMLSSAFWTSAVSDMFPLEKRGRIFGVRSMFTGLSALIATYGAGQLLDVFLPPMNFTIAFFVAALLAGVGTFYLAALKPPETAEPDGSGWHGAAGSSNFRDFFAFLRKPSGKSLLHIAVPTALFNLGFILAGPITNIYYVEILSLTNTEIGLLTSTFIFFQVVGSVLWGGLADRFGNFVVLVYATAGMAIQAFLFWVIPTVPYLVLVQAFGGFCNAGFLIASFNALIGTGKSHERPVMVAWFHTIGNLAGFFAPFIGTWTFTHHGLIVTFVVAGLFRCAASALYYRGQVATRPPMPASFSPSRENSGPIRLQN